MNFQSCSIIIPVIRETDLFEKVIGEILDSCAPEELKEFIIVVHPKYTAEESYISIDKMQQRCTERGISYQVLEQKLPGMGGAMRDALDIAKGSHTIITNADMALDPRLVPKLIQSAKQFPEDITSVSRHTKSSKIEKGYDKLKLAWNVLAQNTVLFSISPTLPILHMPIVFAQRNITMR